jgi:hypothetical protein
VYSFPSKQSVTEACVQKWTTNSLGVDIENTNILPIPLVIIAKAINVETFLSQRNFANDTEIKAYLFSNYSVDGPWHTPNNIFIRGYNFTNHFKEVYSSSDGGNLATAGRYVFQADPLKSLYWGKIGPNGELQNVEILKLEKALDCEPVKIRAYNGEEYLGEFTGGNGRIKVCNGANLRLYVAGGKGMDFNWTNGKTGREITETINTQTGKLTVTCIDNSCPNYGTSTMKSSLSFDTFQEGTFVLFAEPVANTNTINLKTTFACEGQLKWFKDGVETQEFNGLTVPNFEKPTVNVTYKVQCYLAQCNRTMESPDLVFQKPIQKVDPLPYVALKMNKYSLANNETPDCSEVAEFRLYTRNGKFSTSEIFADEFGNTFQNDFKVSIIYNDNGQKKIYILENGALTFYQNCGENPCASSFSLTTNKTIACNGESITLTANSCNGVLKWTDDTNLSSNQLNTTYYGYKPNYYATCKPTGCANEISASISINSYNNNPPTATIENDSNGKPSGIRANNTFGNLQWYKNGIAMSGQNGSYISASPGMYQIKCTSNECSAGLFSGQAIINDETPVKEPFTQITFDNISDIFATNYSKCVKNEPIYNVYTKAGSLSMGTEVAFNSGTSPALANSDFAFIKQIHDNLYISYKVENGKIAGTTNCPTLVYYEPYGKIKETVCDYNTHETYIVKHDGQGGTYNEARAYSLNCYQYGEIIYANQCDYQNHKKYNTLADGAGGTYIQIIDGYSYDCGGITEGKVISEGCSDNQGTYYKQIADGKGGILRTDYFYNQTSCGYVAPPCPSGVWPGEKRCDGVMLRKWVCDGLGSYTYGDILENYNTSQCGGIAEGTPTRGALCIGVDKYQKVADGNGGFKAGNLIETNSIECGYCPDGTWDGDYDNNSCINGQVHRQVCDGNGGFRYQNTGQSCRNGSPQYPLRANESTTTITATEINYNQTQIVLFRQNLE